MAQEEQGDMWNFHADVCECWRFPSSVLLQNAGSLRSSLGLARMLIVSVFCSYLADCVVVFYKKNQLFSTGPGK